MRVCSACGISTTQSAGSGSRPWSSSSPSAIGTHQRTRFADDALVAVRVGFAEVELRRRVKEAGGKWNPSRKAWELRYASVVALKLQARIVEEGASHIGCRG